MNNTNPYTTDFIALGLPDRCAFDVLKQKHQARKAVPSSAPLRPGRGREIKLKGSREQQILRVNPESPGGSTEQYRNARANNCRIAGKTFILGKTP